MRFFADNAYFLMYKMMNFIAPICKILRGVNCLTYFIFSKHI